MVEMDNKNLLEDREILTLFVYKAIEQALKDLVYPSMTRDHYISKKNKKPARIKLQEDAKNWLQSDECAFYCDAIRINHNWLIKEIDRIEHNGFSIKIKKERVCKPYKAKDKQ